MATAKFRFAKGCSARPVARLEGVPGAALLRLADPLDAFIGQFECFDHDFRTFRVEVTDLVFRWPRFRNNEARLILPRFVLGPR